MNEYRFVDCSPGNVRDILSGGDSDSSVHSSDVDEDVADEINNEDNSTESQHGLDEEAENEDSNGWREWNEGKNLCGRPLEGRKVKDCVVCSSREQGGTRKRWTAPLPIQSEWTVHAKIIRANEKPYLVSTAAHPSGKDATEASTDGQGHFCLSQSQITYQVVKRDLRSVKYLAEMIWAISMDFTRPCTSGKNKKHPSR
ncbi:hypothetical protein J6590_028551 [Homalodisca vitripennis]|nr:hypothetical protein J6590_028551 [Homalodisca vitripennis]